jgi:hypothetical protein
LGRSPRLIWAVASITEAYGTRPYAIIGCEVRYCRSHRGWYHTDRQPGDASQYTARCPCALPPLNSTAGSQSHSDQDTVIRPGPTHARSSSVPGNTTNPDAAPPSARLEHTCENKSGHTGALRHPVEPFGEVTLARSWAGGRRTVPAGRCRVPPGPPRGPARLRATRSSTAVNRPSACLSEASAAVSASSAASSRARTSASCRIASRRGICPICHIYDPASSPGG